MLADDFERQRITIAIHSPEDASIRVGVGWLCSVYECGRVPIEVEALCKHIERKYGKPVKEEDSCG